MGISWITLEIMKSLTAVLCWAHTLKCKKHKTPVKNMSNHVKPMRQVISLTHWFNLMKSVKLVTGGTEDLKADKTRIRKNINKAVHNIYWYCSGKNQSGVIKHWHCFLMLLHSCSTNSWPGLPTPGLHRRHQHSRPSSLYTWSIQQRFLKKNQGSEVAQVEKSFSWVWYSLKGNYLHKWERVN